MDGAWTPLLKRMQAFSPASSKVDLVEAAEAHAQKLNQLAINLSGYVAPPRVHPECLRVHLAHSRVKSLGGFLEGGEVIPEGSRCFVASWEVWGPNLGGNERI